MGKSVGDLQKALKEKRDALRDFRFSNAGAKTKDLKVMRQSKKDVARIMTELNRNK